jgi:hypothetical protein
LHRFINQLAPPNAKDYSNPEHEFLLPYPSLWEESAPENFSLIQQPQDEQTHLSQPRLFRYNGRAPFAAVWKRVEELGVGGCPNLYLFGTMGFGKSYILAALACLLMRTGKRVVYLPDCGVLLHPGSRTRYLKQALLRAFSDPSSYSELRQIESCPDLDALAKFCYEYGTTHGASKAIYLVVDRLEALDVKNRAEVSTGPDFNDPPGWKIYRYLLELVVFHCFISSASANCQFGLGATSRCETEIRLFGGLTSVSRAFMVIFREIWLIPNNHFIG